MFEFLRKLFGNRKEPEAPAQSIVEPPPRRKSLILDWKHPVRFGTSPAAEEQKRQKAARRIMRANA